MRMICASIIALFHIKDIQMKGKISKILGACALVLSSSVMANEMSFFITSEGSGDGANLGGLEGADAHCSKLAKAVGSNKSYL